MAKEVLDDAVTKKLQKEMDSHIEVLLIEKDNDHIYYTQGYIAALRFAIAAVKQNNKQRIANEEEDDE